MQVSKIQETNMAKIFRKLDFFRLQYDSYNLKLMRSKKKRNFKILLKTHMISYSSPKKCGKDKEWCETFGES